MRETQCCPLLVWQCMEHRGVDVIQAVEHLFVAVVGGVAIALIDQNFADRRICGANMIKQAPGKRALAYFQAQVGWPAGHLLKAVQNQFLRIRRGLVTKKITVVCSHQPSFLGKCPGFFLQAQRYADAVLQLPDFSRGCSADHFIGGGNRQLWKYIDKLFYQRVTGPLCQLIQGRKQTFAQALGMLGNPGAQLLNLRVKVVHHGACYGVGSDQKSCFGGVQ